MTEQFVDLTYTEPQHDFMNLTCKYPAFIAGYGTGKSEIMCNQAIQDAHHSASSVIAMYEPTYDLIKLILVPRMEQKLIDAGIRFKYNKSDHIFYSMSTDCGDFILRTMDNPARIIGYESYRAHVDEIDTLTTEKAKDVWNKIIARNRQSPDDIPVEYQIEGKRGILMPYNRVSAYSTPEGFKFAYKKWGKNPSKNYQMIQASTRTNPFLPDDYIDGLTETYGDTPLLEAYIEGNFVNLTSGQVYYSFDRKLNNTDVVHEKGEHIHVGMDFNVRNMNATIWVERKGKSYCVDEIVQALDTESISIILKEKYPDITICIYPDASGKNTSSKGASKSDLTILRSHGFMVKASTKNPFIKDRVISFNVALAKNKIAINTEKCPSLTLALEQQIYDKNGMPEKNTETNIDDINDATGYYIFSRYPVLRKIVKAW